MTWFNLGSERDPAIRRPGRAVGLVLLIALAILALRVAAKIEDVEHACENRYHWLTLDQQIAACTTLIDGKDEDPHNLALAFDYRGDAYYQQGKFAAAVADFTSSIRLNPDDPVPYFLRGDSYTRLADWDRAIADYSQTIRLDPANTWPWNNRGWAYFKKGNIDRAISDYNQAIRLDPKNHIAFANLGDALVARGEFEPAIVAYSRQLQLDPNNGAGWNARGSAYYRKGDLARAIGDFEIASRLDPKNPLPFGNLGDIYADKKQFDLALQYYSAALRNDPRNAYGYNARGFVYAEKGELDLAIADFETALQLKPDFAPAMQNRALVYQMKGLPPPPLDASTALARSIQVELRRLGCDPDTPDGIWGPASQRALAAYNRSAGTNYLAPLPELLEDLRRRSAPMCGSGMSVPPAPEQPLAETWKSPPDCPLDAEFSLQLSAGPAGEYKRSPAAMGCHVILRATGCTWAHGGDSTASCGAISPFRPTRTNRK